MPKKPTMRAGWYPDPEVSARARWWDGQAWTRWLSPSRTAAPPPAGGDRVVPVPTLRDRLVRIGVWVALAAVVVTAAMTVVGVVINQRNRPPAMVVNRNPSPAVTRQPVRINDLEWSPSGQVKFGRVGTIELPQQGWEVLEYGRVNDMKPVYEGRVTTRRKSTQQPGQFNAMMLAGLAKQVFAVESLRSTAETLTVATARDQYKFAPTAAGPKVVVSEKYAAPGDRPAWRVRVSVTDPELKGDTTQWLVEMIYLEAEPGTWAVVSYVSSAEVAKSAYPDFEKSLTTLTFAS